MTADGLRDVLLTLSRTARDKLRRVLILDQPNRDEIAQLLLRYGDGWADVIDTLTMYPEAAASRSADRRYGSRRCIARRDEHAIVVG